MACVREEDPPTRPAIHRRRGTTIEWLRAIRYFHLHQVPGGRGSGTVIFNFGRINGFAMIQIDVSSKSPKIPPKQESTQAGAIGCLVIALFVGGCVVVQGVSRQLRGISSSSSEGWQEKQVTRKQFGKAWPLTVSGGRVRVYDGIYITFIDAKGNEYAVNGSAQDCGFPPIDPIWRKGKGTPGVEISPLFDVARELGQRAVPLNRHYELMRTIGRPAPGGQRIRSN
jgi:hypothetical protein